MFHISSCLTIFAYITYLNITGHAPPPACGREGVKNFRKVVAGVGADIFSVGGGGYIGGGGVIVGEDGDGSRSSVCIGEFFYLEVVLAVDKFIFSK